MPDDAIEQGLIGVYIDGQYAMQATSAAAQAMLAQANMAAGSLLEMLG